MLLVVALLFFLGTGAYGQYQLNIRESGKLCTQWISLTSGSISLTYTNNPECASPVALEQEPTRVRICCQALATTTSSSNFPRECGKQKFQPSRARIVGGVHAAPNSWVSEIEKLMRLFCHSSHSLLAMANPLACWWWPLRWIFDRYSSCGDGSPLFQSTP